MAKKKVRVKLINIRHSFNETPDLRDLVSACLRMPPQDIISIQIIKRAVDARQERLDLVYTIAVELYASQKVLNEILKRTDVSHYDTIPTHRPHKLKKNQTCSPVIIGCGPSGLFAALTLVERGARPIIFERGARMVKRIRDVNEFWTHGVLNIESNVLFGEGGAGTFSDGKLTTRIKSPFRQKVLHELVKFGAPEEILFVNKPHLGTDRIRQIICAMVDSLGKRGAQFFFETKVHRILFENGQVNSVQTNRDIIKTDTVFLGCGHSARDMFESLRQDGIVLEKKGFAVGLRIEHPQEFINRAQWGKWCGTPGLGPADYFLTYTDRESGRGVYTFCMCPGGYIISCSTYQGELATNGMSYYRRDSPWANAAVVVTIAATDFKAPDPLAGLEFQKALEHKAFIMGGEQFKIPAQRARDFFKREKTKIDSATCSCLPGAMPADLNELLPEFLNGPLKQALEHFNRKIAGFIDEGTLFGVETRTSSPVRIKRHAHNFQAIGVKGLFPIGEGAGYAGGIMSCAVDGIRAALSFDQD